MRTWFGLWIGLTMAFLLVFSAPVLAGDATFTDDDDVTLSSCVEAAGIAFRNGADVTEADCIGITSTVCMATAEGQSTLGSTQCAYAEQAWWDMLLNARYQSLRSDLAPDLFATLREAQRAWIKYRDADCRVRYDFWEGGSIRNPIIASCLLAKTANRAIELGDLLDWTGG
ncbi:MAG: DUF1311 domain-containing protein [Alphaproteobacteria bacterium]|nr:DUF1311 domain-containing protein [Alphaproteobacteria bacterium]